MVSPPPPTPMGSSNANPCEGKKPGFPNVNCTAADLSVAVNEQAGANVTLGYV